MQNLTIQRSCTSLRAHSERPVSRSARLVVRASAADNDSSRRQVFTTMLAAGMAVIGVQAPAQAIDVFDDRKAKDNGFDIIYEARDLDLSQNIRDGLDQYRNDVGLTRQRIKEATMRIDSAIDPWVKKQYWTNAREELRLQVGTLRFDLNTLGNKLEKSKRKEVEALKKTFLSNADTLDYAIRQKNQTKATDALVAVKSSLDGVIKAIQ